MFREAEVLSCQSYHLPSRELTYPQKWHFEDDFPFPKVGYVNFLEGIYFYLLMLNFGTSIVEVTTISGCLPNFGIHLMYTCTNMQKVDIYMGVSKNRGSPK